MAVNSHSKASFTYMPLMLVGGELLWFNIQILPNTTRSERCTMEHKYKFTSKGPLLLVTGPAGGGKNSVISRLTSHFHFLIESISVSTRWPARPGEQNWRTYHYTDESRFLWMLQTQQFAETTRIHNNSYGTLGVELETLWSRGLSVIIGVDTAGVDNFHDLRLDPISVFVDAPDEQTQEQRLLLRDPNITPDDMKIRLAMSQEERNWAMEAESDGKVTRVVNDDLDDCVRRVAKCFNLEWDSDHLATHS